MTNEEKILEMLGSMQNDINSMKSDMRGIKAEITKLHSKVDALTEAHEETRGAVNAIVDWTDKVSVVSEFPLPKL